MQVGKGNRILFLILLCLAVALSGACTYKGGSGRVSEMQEFDSFFSTHSDSVVMAAALDESTGIAENGKNQR